MEIKHLSINNINDLKCNILSGDSISIAGLSGSGKTTFCQAVCNESLKRLIKILPKSEYRFLYSDLLKSEYSYNEIFDLPLIFFLGKKTYSNNPRSTVGTHTGIFNSIRKCMANKYNIGSEIFSFNNSFLWCPQCKGRGMSSGIICKKCFGKRYSDKEKEFYLDCDGKKSISELNKLDMFALLKYNKAFNISENEQKIIENFINLGIGYLSLDRITNTLSGGEYLRMLLAEFLTYCKDCILIIDEVSSGIDYKTLQTVMQVIKNEGTNNQLWFIDHSDYVINATDNKMFFGPKSGLLGGMLVKESPRPEPVYLNVNSNRTDEYYLFTNLKKRNINISKLEIPKNRLIAITGESGCGKSTLVMECIVPQFKKTYKNGNIIIIEQNRNQSITSKSTIETFIGVKKWLNKYKITTQGYILDDLLKEIGKIRKKSDEYKKIKLLNDLGLGYLSLDRKIQSLSTGEFQCVHLVANLFNHDEKSNVFVFDEPSKGLSQNILNKFMSVLRDLLNNDNDISIIMIEHNLYMLKNSDFIIDFGQKKDNVITDLSVIENKKWNSDLYEISKNEIKVTSSRNSKCGIKVFNERVDEIFNKAVNDFKGGVLKNISPTAEWIYNNYFASAIEPIIALDLEDKLYSKNTFLYELSVIMDSILLNDSEKMLHNEFNLINPECLCESCKGTGKITSFDIKCVIADENRNLFDGFLNDDVFLEIKKYNLSKIKGLFSGIKKESGLDLLKPYSKMSTEEKNVFLFGYWDNVFYDKNKNTYRRWQGIIFLILKYIKASKKDIKKVIYNTKKEVICPCCGGTNIKSKKEYYLNEHDIKSYFKYDLSVIDKWLVNNYIISDLMSIVSHDVTLMADVSNFDIRTQVKLKLWEIKTSSLSGYKIYIKNSLPFTNEIKELIGEISQKNEVILLDYMDVKYTKEEILKMFFSSGKIKSNTWNYELLNFKGIYTKVNKIHKKYPCKYCSGKGYYKEESLFEGVDVTKTPCKSCFETGISEEGMNEIVDGFHVRDWLTKDLSYFTDNKNEQIKLKFINPMKHICDLNKKELMAIKRKD